jgi:predicted DNA-binding transcriptional regulator YafY
MRRADRLFQIVQSLRRRSRATRSGLTRAADLASELEVSLRTIYRDIADLQAAGVPVEGAAGVGYVLREGYDLPPMMFSLDEIEAIALGCAVAASWGDPGLVKAADDVRAKVAAVLTPELRAAFLDSALVAPDGHRKVPVSVDMAGLRHAIRARHKLHLVYTDEAERRSERIVRPLALAFYGPIWLMLAWCELREGFRSFRVDRMAAAVATGARFAPEVGKRREDYIALLGAEKTAG